MWVWSLGYFLNGHDRAAELLIELDHLRQYAVAFEVQAQVVRQHHGEWLITDQRTAGENRVAQALHLDLAGVGESAGVDQLAGAVQDILLIGATNLVFQLVS